MSNIILHKKISDGFNLLNPRPIIPSYITNNLSHSLRPYQEEAIEHLIYSQSLDSSYISFNHLLFHMATGSGKTLILAANILYMFAEKNIQNFIFFVNSDAIIEKTLLNLSNDNSNKYLFNKEGINIKGKKISIRVCDVFSENPDPNTIYLKFTTIQKLHRELTEPKENSITFDSLSNTDLVLLADEAHHINAWTRRDKKKLNANEQEERTWESTVQRILKLRRENRLFEYTATIDLKNDLLFEKYKDKIVYQYDLQKFMNDGYSKNVSLLRADEDDEIKVINALLLSQYRKYIALDNNIYLKPVILFKSNTIKISHDTNVRFDELVYSLTPKKMEEYISRGLQANKDMNNTWSKVFKYYSKKNLVSITKDIKYDFSKQNVLNANNREFLTTENSILLNTLEEDSNPIRVIFAVAKLNEGWDVLNLFDIVRISEGATNTRNTTDSEAQLIGRGARYYPFKVDDSRAYKRRFDNKNSELKIIENLHYHTMNDNSYIKNLERSLDTAKIQIREDEYRILSAKIKPKFKKTEVFKNGKIYINKLVETSAEDYDRLEKYGVENGYRIANNIVIEHLYGVSAKEKINDMFTESRWVVETQFLRKGIQRNPFFYFSTLKTYVPGLKSIDDFIYSEQFLGRTELYIEHPKSMSLNSFSPKHKLSMIDEYLSYIEAQIRKNYKKERGTPVFEGIAVSEVFDDYHLEITNINSKIQSFDEIIESSNMRDSDWYIYDKAIVNRLERSLINFVSNYLDKLEDQYDEVYLIRNERKVKIVEIDGIRGFMPDFLLYLRNEELTMQVFIEPKGDHLLEKDKWKEDFLLSLSTRKDIKILDEDENVRLLGLKFYNQKNYSGFIDDFTLKVLE